MLTTILIAAAAAALSAVITWLVMHARLEAVNTRLESEKKLQQLQQDAFDKQLELVKSQLSAETEKLLKQREEALQKKAEETFRNITGPLGKDR